MEIYDYPAMALIFSIVESSTSHKTKSDAKLSKVIERSMKKFELWTKEQLAEKKVALHDECYYHKYKDYMDALYIYTFTGGTMKSFCETNELPVTSISFAFRYYRELNGIRGGR